MLCREIIAVCSEIHTKHVNTLCGQNEELLNVKLVVLGLKGLRVLLLYLAYEGDRNKKIRQTNEQTKIKSTSVAVRSVVISRACTVAY